MNTTAEAEEQAAIRLLLSKPLVGDDRREELAAIRRHRRSLERFFSDELGYRLDANKPGQARLAKMPGPGHVARGLATRSGRPFDPRKYALICLVLASAEMAGERTTAARLFAEVASRAEAIDALVFSTEVAADRRAFVQAVQAAEALGVLELAEGNEEGFARGEQGADALYRVDRERLALLPTTPAPPSLLASPEQMAAEVYPETEEGRTRRRRHRVMRALVEQPVVYADDLATDEREYLSGQRARIERLLAERAGLTLEIRAEGWVTVDEAGEMSDVNWPDYGAADVAALRICDELRRRRGRMGAGPVWPMAEVGRFVGGLAAQYEGHWPQGAQDGDEARGLADRAVSILEALRLARRTHDGLIALPAAARFALADDPASTAEWDPGGGRLL